LAGSKSGSVCIALLLAGAAGGAGAQQIYTCVDAKGRRITSDRPIGECMDRAQQQLNSSGTVRRVIKPALTAEEQAAEDEKARRAADARQREEEEKRRNRALHVRYPDADSHLRERNATLRTIDDTIAAGRKREGDLEAERQKLAPTGSAADPATRLRIARQLEEIQRQLTVQKRQIADALEEKKKINARFDDELARLKPLWAQQGVPPVARKP
jgi:hypothetical protein